MNICIAVKTMTHPMGGVCTHIIDLCRYYSSQGHNIILLADGTDYKQTTDQINGLTYIEVDFQTVGMNPLRIFSAYKKVKKTCIDHKVDIIHLHSQSIIPVAWLCKLTIGVPFLWTNHIDAIPQPKVLALMHKTMSFPVISVSDELKDDLILRLRFKDKNLFVVYNGIDFSSYSPLSEDEKIELKRNYDIYDDEFVISELARLTFGKGQDLLIKAVDKLQQKYPERKFHILFAGTGHQEWFEHNVMQYANKKGIKATYLGFQNPRNVFGVSSVSVLPSLFEGFALTVMESLAMECPAIRSDSPGWSSMKSYCITFPRGDIDKLTDSLEDMIEEYPKWKSITIDCQSEIKERFSKEQMGKATIDIYNKILSRED